LRLRPGLRFDFGLGTALSLPWTFSATAARMTSFSPHD
jgi:hypothetical protein